MLVLHDYFRSGASHRVRIALNLKGLAYEQRPRHLRKGEQRAADYLSINPQGLVPTLEHDGVVVAQSIAILEYLEEAFPDTTRLLPADPAGRARARSLAMIIAADTHPLNNLRVLKYLESDLGLGETERLAWCGRWLSDSFAALEARLGEPQTGRFCHGDSPGFADLCLAPQMLSAKRFGVPIEPYPRVRAVHANAMELDAFRRAEPENQPDAE